MSGKVRIRPAREFDDFAAALDEWMERLGVDGWEAEIVIMPDDHFMTRYEVSAKERTCAVHIGVRSLRNEHEPVRELAAKTALLMLLASERPASEADDDVLKA